MRENDGEVNLIKVGCKYHSVFPLYNYYMLKKKRSY
jgi:hypothetical protein